MMATVCKRPKAAVGSNLDWATKKCDFERPNLRKVAKNLAKPPPKWWSRPLVHDFHFQPFFPLKGQKLKSGCGHSILVEIVQFCGTGLRYHGPKTNQKWSVV